MNYGEIAKLLLETECAECRKIFERPTKREWGYKRGSSHKGTCLFFCSWSCLRKYDREHGGVKS